MMAVVMENAAANNAKKITRIELVVGKLAGVVPDALRFCFETLKEETIAKDAALIIHEVAATAHCATCNLEREVGLYDYFCPTCEGPVFPKGGDELNVKDIEIE